MARRNAPRGGWDDQQPQGAAGYSDDEQYSAAYAQYDAYDQYGEQGGGDYPADGGDAWYPGDEERGLVLQQEQSLVGVSNTITQHGVPLLSYTRTMNRFYNNRKQRLSLGRFKCEVCGRRIRFWAWQTETHKRTHDGCYERLAWTWTNLYAQQQQLASQGRFE
jgi:hypothetical protein